MPRSALKALSSVVLVALVVMALPGYAQAGTEGPSGHTVVTTGDEISPRIERKLAAVVEYLQELERCSGKTCATVTMPRSVESFVGTGARSTQCELVLSEAMCNLIRETAKDPGATAAWAVQIVLELAEAMYYFITEEAGCTLFPPCR